MGLFVGSGYGIGKGQQFYQHPTKLFGHAIEDNFESSAGLGTQLYQESSSIHPILNWEQAILLFPTTRLIVVYTKPDPTGGGIDLRWRSG